MTGTDVGGAYDVRPKSEVSYEGDLVDLACERFGGTVVACNDAFFAPVSSMLMHGPPLSRPGAYTEQGTWMDGWETRRRRTPGHDWAIVRLGAPGVVASVTVDTTYFTGNAPESVELQGCDVPGYPAPADLTADGTEWVTLVPRTVVKPDTSNVLAADPSVRVTHVRLVIHPDGGVARLRVFGRAVPDPRLLDPLTVDLGAAEHGAVVVGASDMHYGDRHNLNAPNDARVMGEGWETRRLRGPGNDWAVVRLAAEGTVVRAEVDTRHFKGNAPESCLLSVTTGGPPPDLRDDAWRTLLPRTRLLPHTLHRFDVEPAGAGDHVRVDVLPDGGLARLRLWGRPSAAGRLALGLRWFGALSPARARAELYACCASTRWAAAVARRRPADGLDALLAIAREEWSRTGPEDWREAIAAHPRIGESDGAAATRTEQAAALAASPSVLAELAEGNRAYEERFAMTYLVRAAGRSARELLDLLRERLGNDPDTELRVAAGQQAEITDLRLRRLIAGPAASS